MSQPEPPKAYLDFIAKYPKLEEAWGTVADAGQDGPLDERTQRLIKIGIAMGAMREGAVRSGVRKARAMGIEDEAVDQVIALAAGTLGFPSTVALFTWAESVRNPK